MPTRKKTEPKLTPIQEAARQYRAALDTAMRTQADGDWDTVVTTGKAYLALHNEQENAARRAALVEARRARLQKEHA